MGGGEVSDGYGGVWGRGRALACRRVTAGVMAVEPERRDGGELPGGGRGCGGGGAVITSPAYQPPYFRANTFFLSVPCALGPSAASGHPGA